MKLLSKDPAGVSFYMEKTHYLCDNILAVKRPEPFRKVRWQIFVLGQTTDADKRAMRQEENEEKTNETV